ncbi:phage head spike fiber domain-containing protein [Vreelandella sp. EE27]
MANRVTFPAALGGDGKTYSDDADPNTGLDGLGYITRLVPLMKNAVAMAGYTQKYAAKIDAAARNAERAENAQKYVEAYAGSLRNNLTAFYKRKATLIFDFAGNEYVRDNGDRVVNSANELIKTTRSSPKYVLGPDRKMREISSNMIARHWGGGQDACASALIEWSSTNILPLSQMADGQWPITRTQNAWANTPVQKGDVVLDRFTGGSVRLTDVSSTTEVATWSVYFHDKGEDENTTVIRGELRGQDTAAVGELYFDYSSKTFSSNNNDGVTFDYEDLGGGFYRVWLTVSALGLDVERLRTAIYGTNKWLGGFQIEEWEYVTSYIPTRGTPATRSRDFIAYDLNGEAGINLTVVIKARFVNRNTRSGSRDGVIQLSGNDSNNSRLVITRDQRQSNRLSVICIDNGTQLFSSGLNMSPQNPGNSWFTAAISCSSTGVVLAVDGNTYASNLISELNFIEKIVLARDGGFVTPSLQVEECFLLPEALNESELKELTA